MRKNSLKKIEIDLTTLEPIDVLDADEQALHQVLQQGGAQLRSDSETVQKYTNMFKTARQQRKAISLRLPTDDYLAIKAKASELGLPYQALINSLIHQYVTGRIKEV